MSNTGVRRLLILVAFITAISTIVGAYYYANCLHLGDAPANSELYSNAESTIVGMMQEQDKRVSATGEKAKERLSQRVTVCGKEGILPISGTVTKSVDEYYPGTYEIEFSDMATIDGGATVQLDVDLPVGEPVYILTGDKNSGYDEVDVVTVDNKGRVSFETDEIKSFVISTTDIARAQTAVEGFRIFAENMPN